MSKYIAGIDVGGTNIKLGIVDHKGNIVWEAKGDTPYGNSDLLLDKICNMLEQACSQYRIQAIGIGCPGYADKVNGIINDAANLGLAEIRFKEVLEKGLKLPVRVDNDVQVAMMAEKAYGACRNVDHAIYITLGTGIGGAFILDGMPYRGNRNYGGEIGHMVIHKDGRLCACGMRGCYEQYASVSALVRVAQEAYGSISPEMAAYIDGKLIFDAIKDGDPVALGIYQDWLDELCVGLISLMSIFAPQRIVIGGGISNEGSFLEASINKHLHSLDPYRAYYSNIEVKVAQLGNRAGIVGAALLHHWLMRES